MLGVCVRFARWEAWVVGLMLILFPCLLDCRLRTRAGEEWRTSQVDQEGKFAVLNRVAVDLSLCTKLILTCSYCLHSLDLSHCLVQGIMPLKSSVRSSTCIVRMSYIGI